MESRGRPRGRAISAQAQPRRRLRGRERESFSTSTASWPRDPPAPVLPRRARGPLPPLPNRLKPLLARAGGWGSLGLGLRVAPGWERGAPLSARSGKPSDAAGALGAVSFGHFQTGRLCSSSLDFLQSWDARLRGAHWVLWHLHEGPRGMEKARPLPNPVLVGTEAKTQFHPPLVPPPRFLLNLLPEEPDRDY